jgi:uncharacterized protein (UPF0332 family)
VRELSSLEECVDKGLLRKVPPSKNKAVESLKKAQVMLEEARANLNSMRINSAVIMAYLAIFNAAKAILFKDGFREKSHACVARYLENKYAQKGKISFEHIELLDRFRSSRHATQYDVSYYPSKKEAEQMIDFAKDFIGKIENILKE